MNRFWRFIVNKGDDGQGSVELRIEGDIVDDDEAWLYEWFGTPSTTPNAFKEELNRYKGKDITVWIDSDGGSVFAAAGIYNALKEHDGKITVKVGSKAMSAASVIAMAGDEVLMSPMAVMMIHNPLTGAYGDMHVFRKVADILDTIKDSIINAYVTKTKRSRNKISQMMDEETWMSANVAVKEGFADGILYQDQPLDVANMNMVAFNRLAIVNSASQSIRHAVEFLNKQREQDEKERLLLELDLI